jgi:hypothetical protein
MQERKREFATSRVGSEEALNAADALLSALEKMRIRSG